MFQPETCLLFSIINNHDVIPLMTCMALYKCMKHVSLLFCLWDAQVKKKSPMIIVRTTALPSNWAKTDWIAGNTESYTEYINWQQVPCCHTYVFFCVFLMMCVLSISVILHEQQRNCISYSIVWHSCLFWIILISSTRLSTPQMCIVCFIQRWMTVFICQKKKQLLYFCIFFDKYKLYSDLKSTLKILFS